MKSIIAIWRVERHNPVTGATEPAHAEAWVYEEPGPQYGRFLCNLPDWTEEDCKNQR